MGLMFIFFFYLFSPKKNAFFPFFIGGHLTIEIGNAKDISVLSRAQLVAQQYPGLGLPSSTCASIIATHVVTTWRTIFNGADGQRSTRVAWPTARALFGQSLYVLAGSWSIVKEKQAPPPTRPKSFASQFF